MPGGQGVRSPSNNWLVLDKVLSTCRGTQMSQLVFMQHEVLQSIYTVPHLKAEPACRLRLKTVLQALLAILDSPLAKAGKLKVST